MLDTFALLDLGTPELVLILLIVLLLFGGKKLPELARSIGSSAKELRTGLQGETPEPVREVAPITTVEAASPETTKSPDWIREWRTSKTTR